VKKKNIESDSNIIWSTINNIVSNTKEQMEKLKAEIYLTLNTNKEEIKKLITSVTTSQGVENKENSNVLAEENHLEAKMMKLILDLKDHFSNKLVQVQAINEESFKSYQERMLKIQEDYGEITRNDQINHKVRLDQRYEILSQTFNKKLIKLEDELKTDTESIKMELAEAIVKLDKVMEMNPNSDEFQKELQDRFERYDISFKNIMQNFSSLNLTWLKLQAIMNTQNDSNQETFRSIWSTIGLLGQQIVDVKKPTSKG